MALYQWVHLTRTLTACLIQVLQTCGYQARSVDYWTLHAVRNCMASSNKGTQTVQPLHVCVLRLDGAALIFFFRV